MYLYIVVYGMDWVPLKPCWRSITLHFRMGWVIIRLNLIKLQNLTIYIINFENVTIGTPCSKFWLKGCWFDNFYWIHINLLTLGIIHLFSFETITFTARNVAPSYSLRNRSSKKNWCLQELLEHVITVILSPAVTHSIILDIAWFINPFNYNVYMFYYSSLGFLLQDILRNTLFL